MVRGAVNRLSRLLMVEGRDTTCPRQEYDSFCNRKPHQWTRQMRQWGEARPFLVLPTFGQQLGGDDDDDDGGDGWDGGNLAGRCGNRDGCSHSRPPAAEKQPTSSLQN